MDVYVSRLSHRLRRRLTGNRQQHRAQARYLGLPGSIAAYSKCQVSIRRGAGFDTSGLGAARAHEIAKSPLRLEAAMAPDQENSSTSSADHPGPSSRVQPITGG